MERRLTTILAADIAGFSRLVGMDEEGTLSDQRGHRSKLIDPLIAEYGGRLANTAGDSLLVEFSSAVQAVRCAVDLQDGMVKRNANVPNERRINYRIGINVGDVVLDGNDLLGDGVNIAARLEAMSPPGGVVLSRTVRDQIRDKVDIKLEDLGEVEVKNIARAIRVFRVAGPGATPGGQNLGGFKHRRFSLIAGACFMLLVALAAMWWFAGADFEPVRPSDMAHELPDGPSIAVVPFHYIGSNAAENGWIAEGISENIVANLATLPGLLVVVNDAKLTSKGDESSIREIAKRSSVRHVLLGSTQKSGEKLRVSAQLLDAVAGKHLWSATFDRDMGDIFLIQDEITLAILERAHVGVIDGDRLEYKETSDLQAFAENAKGRSHRNKFTVDGNRKARAHYDAALSLDPDYPDALVGISFTHIMDVRLGYSEDPAGSLALAEKYLSRALELQPDRPATLSNFAVLRVVQKRRDEALDFVRRAVKNGASDARVVRGMAWVLKYSGESRESLSFFAQAKRMTPVPQWWLIADEFGAFLDAEDYAAAVNATDTFLAAAPEGYRPVFLVWAAVAALHIGDVGTAEALVAEARSLKPDVSIADIRPLDLAYIDDVLPERRYASMRELGLSD